MALCAPADGVRVPPTACPLRLGRSSRMQVKSPGVRFWGSVLLGGLAAQLAFPTLADAAGNGAGHPSETIFILQIILLIAVGRGLGEIMQRLGQPSVMGELLAGIVLGPSIFGAFWPDAQHAIFPNSPEQKALI